MYESFRTGGEVYQRPASTPGEMLREMSRCGTLRTWAQELGLDDAVRLLVQTLDEEKKTDAALTKIAESVVNQQAEAA